MALVALLLFTLIFGIIAYGYMMSFRQALTQAAAEGARAGAVAPVGSATANALAAVNEALVGYALDCPIGNPGCRPCEALGMTCDVTEPAPCENNPDHNCVKVAVSYTYAARPLLPAPPLLGFIYPDNLGFTAVSETNQ